MVVACVLPLSALSFGVQFLSYRNARAAAEQRTLEVARSLSLALDRELQARISLLQVLALSRRLQDGDIEGFKVQAETMVINHLLPDTAILLLTEDGNEVMNTAVPHGTPLPSRRNLDTIRQVFATGRPSVSGVFAGTADGRPVVAIEVPVLRPQGGVAYVLALNPPFAVFSEIIRKQQPSEGWVVALFDALGIIVARVPGDFVGQPTAPGFLARVLAEREGIVETTALEGTSVLSAFSHTGSFGWGAGVAVPHAMLTARPWRTAIGTLAAGGALLLAGLIMATVMARQITIPIAALRRLAVTTNDEPTAEPLASNLPETAEVAAAFISAAHERHLALEAGKVGIFNWDLRHGNLRWDGRMRSIWAVPDDAPADATTFFAGIHPDDRVRMIALFNNASQLSEDGIFVAECRIIGLINGEQRSVATRGRVIYEDGQPARVLGTVVDITERRAAEERQTLLAHEVDHRAKNVLAVVQSIIRMTPRTVTPKEFAMSIEGRVTAMGRAHSVLAAEHWIGADLRTIVEGEVAAHAGSVQIEGPPVRLAPTVAQPMGILLHEVVTNATKHGALSQPDGTAQLSWAFQANAGLRLSWTECGGPAIRAEPTRSGFGSKLIAALAEGQLGGILQYKWLPTGLQLILTLPPEHAKATPEMAGLPWTEASMVAPPRPISTLAHDLTVAGGRVPNVLVVEDEILLAMELETAVRALGCVVIGPARSLVEAVRLAAGEPRPDAAVLDVNLAGEMVFPVVDILKTRGVPVLFATGYGSSSTLVGRNVETPAVLHKPYPSKLLGDALYRAFLPGERSVQDAPPLAKPP